MRNQFEQYRNNPNMQKFLNVISQSEGTASFSNPYLAQGGTKGQLLPTGYAHHPYEKGYGKWTFNQTDGKKNYSTAHGRYAFTYPAWQDAQKSLGRLTFSPQDQDLAAIWAINRRGALNDVINGNFTSAINKLGGTWASLPSAPAHYKQFKRGWGEIQNAFKNAGSDYQLDVNNLPVPNNANTMQNLGGGTVPQINPATGRDMSDMRPSEMNAQGPSVLGRLVGSTPDAPPVMGPSSGILGKDYLDTLFTSPQYRNSIWRE